MSFDEELRRAFETVGDHLRDEVARRLSDTAAQLMQTATAEREAARSAARQDAANAAAAEREEAVAAARQEALAQATAEREQVMAVLAHEHEQAIQAAADEAARHAREQALADAEHEAEARVATAAAAAEARGREQASAEAQALLADVERALREAEERARAAQEESHSALQQMAAETQERIAAVEAALGEAEQRAHALEVQSRTSAEQAAAEAQQRIAALEAALHEAEQRAHAAQEASRAALDRAAAAARTEARGVEAEAIEQVLAGMRRIDAARSLSDVLDALVAAAARETGRAGVLLVRADQLRGWRFEGFEHGVDQTLALDVQHGDAGLLADAVSTKVPVVGDRVPRFAALPAGRTAIAVPLALAGDVVAVLYADRGDGAEDGGQIGARVELLARHASSALEAITAFRTARALVDTAAPPTAPTPAVDEPDEAARRYARLLVSEIKLYHEADVLAGRRERNIASRLAGEIDRARALYYERVPADVRAGHDYFHAELVRTLASGDPSLLGEVKA